MMREQNSDPIIFHIDVNSAYLSWSALKLLREGSEVDLRTVPSIVGGDQETRHGIVVAKSIPAKAFGIHTAETVVSAFQKCPNLLTVPPDHHYYSECSRKLMEHLRDICPRIEQVSIDECYMDFEPIRGRFDSPETAATFIRDSVRETFGFTVNVGISDRKVLAKMASDFRKPDLVHTLYVREIQQKLWPLPIERLHMCGKSSAALFRKMGIRTIGDLAQTDPALVENWRKSHGILLWNYANGIDDSKVVTERAQAKGVGNSTTMSEDVLTREEAFKILRRLAESVGKRLRKHGFVAGQVSTEIKYATFRSVSHQTTLPDKTDADDRIFEIACELFDELWNGDPIRLLGVRTTKLEDIKEPVQMSLFDIDWEEQRRQREEALRLEEERQRELERKHAEELERQRLQEEEKLRQEMLKEKHRKMDEAMAAIQKRYGEGSIQKGYRRKENTDIQ